jgi:hypothetical protein
VLRFKTIISRKYKKKFNKIEDLFYQLIKYIQVPYWTHRDDRMYLDKTYFYRNVKDIKSQGLANLELLNNLNKASDIIEEMWKEYKGIGIIASKEPYEFLLPWKWF